MMMRCLFVCVSVSPICVSVPAGSMINVPDSKLTTFTAPWTGPPLVQGVYNIVAALDVSPTAHTSLVLIPDPQLGVLSPIPRLYLTTIKVV